MNGKFILVVSDSVDVKKVLQDTQMEQDFQVISCQDEAELRVALWQMQRHNTGTIYFTLKTRLNMMVWPLDEIVYCQNRDHRITVYLSNGSSATSVTQRLPFLKVVSVLMENGFVQINQSCVVNPAHVVSFSNAEVQTTSGLTLSISRSMREAAIRKFRH